MPVGKVTVTLEDVLHIFGLAINGEVVTSWTDSSHDFLVNQSLAIFGSKPHSVMRYVRCHIFCLLGTTLFVDKSTAHANFLPWLQSFDQIGNYGWGELISRTFTGHCVVHHDGVIILSMTQVSIRHKIEFMEEFFWRPYVDIIIPANYTHTLMSVTLWGHWCHSTVLNGILRTQWEYSYMTGAGFMTNGYNNGVIAALVVCEIGVCSQLSTSLRLLITGVGKL
ncbi:Putative oligosaccharide biosynthesis protein [Arachis hypogaea]|nr:Putative oligosaccharide biosynthesis protein [Arachis hypogaea]